MSARHLAVRVLSQVNTHGAYANIELDKQLREAGISGRDRALATELVYGTIRWQGELDYIISRCSSRPISKMEPMVLHTLRMTAYQLIHLTHIPQHAAVDEAVSLIRELGQHAAAGFVNAVSRRIAREGAPKLFRDSNEPEELAVAYSHPTWLIRRWIANYGLAMTKSMLATNQQPAHVVLRINTLRVNRTDYLANLALLGVSARAGVAPDAVILDVGTPISELPGYNEGLFTIQDESSQLVAYALDPQPGESVADMCSAPGGKATHLAQLMGDQGEVVALELHPHRVELVAATARRLGIECVRAMRHDSREVPDEWKGRFHRILLDAPCLGTGVLRRRVDLRWRIQEDDLDSLARIQTELLAAAAQMLRPEGVLVYSTCSIEPEENQERVAEFLEQHTSFRPGSLAHIRQIVSAFQFPSALESSAEGELRLLPAAGNDGFFLAALRREA